jgi:enoyl-CoA hydratase/carnithine racemase
MKAIPVKRDGHILLVMIDHPNSSLTAFDKTLDHDLGDAFRTLKHEGDARAIVLSGAGRALSAGVSMKWFGGRAPVGTHERVAARSQRDHRGSARCDRDGAGGSIVDPHGQVGPVAGVGGAAR